MIGFNKRGALKIQRSEFSDELMKKEKRENRKLAKEICRLSSLQGTAMKEIHANERLVTSEKKNSVPLPVQRKISNFNFIPNFKRDQSDPNLLSLEKLNVSNSREISKKNSITNASRKLSVNNEKLPKLKPMNAAFSKSMPNKKFGSFGDLLQNQK